MKNQNTERKEKFSSLKTWAKLLPFLRPYRGLMAVVIATMLVNAAVDICYPLLSGYVVDRFVTPRTTEGIAGFAVVYMLVVLLQMTCTIVFARSALKVEMYLGRDLKKTLFTHLQTLSFS